VSLDELKRQFIVKDAFKDRLEQLVSKALKHCQIDEKGQVLILNSRMSGPNQVRLTLAARALASRLEPTILAEVTVADISTSTGLPANQVRARCKDAISANFAEPAGAGVYRAISNKVEAFLDSLSTPEQSKSKKG
jgi:hypothetical protein